MRVIQFRNLILMVLMAVSAIVGDYLQPTLLMAGQVGRDSLASEFPDVKDLKNWKRLNTPVANIVNPIQESVLNKLYAETLGVNLLSSDDKVLMVSIAYGRAHGDGLSVHEPDLCYPSQGFSVLEQRKYLLKIDDKRSVVVRYMKTKRGDRVEPLIYWTTIGDEVYVGKLQRKVKEFEYAVNNIIPDGLVVRVSTLGNDTDASINLMNDFVRQWYRALPEDKRKRYFGSDHT